MIVNPENKNHIAIQYDPSEAGKKAIRLDRFLTDQLNQFSRSQIQRLIDEGQVHVNDQVEKASYRLEAGDRVLLTIPLPVASTIEPQAIPLEIIYEDEYLAVINKPAGMVTHPGAGVFSDTLVHALMHHMQGSLSGIGGVLRPGIVHRLDKDTSGLLVVAKGDHVHQNLSKQIQNKQAQRVYLSVLEGSLPAASGSVNAPIGRHPKKRTEMTILKDGRAAETAYTVLSSADIGLGQQRRRFALVQLSLRTGRTHQIRVHMTSLNCPVVGDLVYNRKTSGTMAARKKLGLIGHALHAYKLSFIHPISNKHLEFSAPIPPDLNALIDKLFPAFKWDQ